MAPKGPLIIPSESLHRRRAILPEVLARRRNVVRNCPACGQSSTGRFCPHCGAGIAGTPSLVRREQRGWQVASALGLVSLVSVLLLVARDRSQAETSAAPAAVETDGAGAAPLPDLNTLTPRERFDRLYNRVMQAAETGDTVTVGRFAPMTFQAYSQLGTLDSDARYHAAILNLHVRSDTAAALRLADSILAGNPRHLFGFLNRGTAAQLSGDTRSLRGAYANFRTAWDIEMKADRPEYRQHQAMLDQFRAQAAR